MSRSHRIRITLVQALIGVVFMVTGLVLALPTLLVAWSYDLADAEILAYYPQPIGDGEDVRLVMTFEYRIRDPADDLETMVIGTGSWNRHGGEVAPRVVHHSDARAEINHLLSKRRPGRAFYDPDRPFTSARYFVDGGLWNFQLGLVLLAAPPLSWLLIMLAQLLVGERRPG